MNYINFHLGDHAKATAHLTPEEDGAYMRLLRWYYTEERPLPVECADIAKIARASEEQTAYLLRTYFRLQDDGWHQKRADREIEKYRAAVELARENGRKSALARAKRSSNVGSANVEVTLNSHTPIANSQTPLAILEENDTDS